MERVQRGMCTASLSEHGARLRHVCAPQDRSPVCGPLPLTPGAPAGGMAQGAEPSNAVAHVQDASRIGLSVSGRGTDGGPHEQPGHTLADLKPPAQLGPAGEGDRKKGLTGKDGMGAGLATSPAEETIAPPGSSQTTLVRKRPARRFKPLVTFLIFFGLCCALSSDRLLPCPCHARDFARPPRSLCQASGSVYFIARISTSA